MNLCSSKAIKRRWIFDHYLPYRGDSQDEYNCEETGGEVILMKDRNGQVIGFEKLNYTPPSATNLRFSFETGTALQI